MGGGGETVQILDCFQDHVGVAGVFSKTCKRLHRIKQGWRTCG